MTADVPAEWIEKVVSELQVKRDGAMSDGRLARAVLAAVLPAIRADAWSDAIGVVERQTNLTELVHFDRPSDFRKGVLTCIAALNAEALEHREEAQ